MNYYSQITNGVFCYGELEDDSNFEVVCEEEEDDMCWTDGNLTTGRSFQSWEEVIDVIQRYVNSPIVEITAC